MVHPETVDQAAPDQRQHELVGLLEHLWVLLAHTRQVIDIEEPAVPAGLGIDVEELSPQRLVGPVGILRARGHVVRDQVENETHSREANGLGELLELLLTAARAVHPGRIGHVVSVGRALASLQGRR